MPPQPQTQPIAPITPPHTAGAGVRRARREGLAYRYPVKPEILRWARQRAGLDIESLQSKFPDIKKWESGKALPTHRQLEKLGKATHTPFGCFFMSEPFRDEYPVPHFCTRGNAPEKPSINMLDTIYHMQLRQGWMREYMIDANIAGEKRAPLDFVASAGRDDSAADVAAKMRDALGIATEWAQTHASWGEMLAALRGRMDDAGIFVVVNGVVDNNPHRALDADEFRGFALADEYAPFVFINNADCKASQMLTLAHAFAHVLYGDSASFDLAGGQPARNRGERMCGQAAAEFLLPGAQLREFCGDVANGRNPYRAIAREFNVSELVAARRLLDVGVIGAAVFREFYDAFMHAGRHWRDAGGGGGDFHGKQDLRVGKRFASAVARSVRSGETQYTEAYRLTGLWGKHFDTYASRIANGKDAGNVCS